MRTTRLLAITFALSTAGATLSACNVVETKSSQSKSATASTSSPSSSDQSSSSSSSSSDSSSESPSSDSSSSSSSSDSGSPVMNDDDVRDAAENGTTRACQMKDLAQKDSAEFCSIDSTSITASYQGERLYFTTAVKFEKGADYSFDISNGSQQESKSLDASSTSADSGAILTLSASAPMQQSGSYSVTFKKNGQKISSKEVSVTVD